jgi:predicted ATPase/DNA-binding SARP family transcriptional activator
MAELRLMTLGRVSVLMGERDITADVPAKMVALLVYLARLQQPKSRETLAEFFWSDRTAQQAFGSLRTAISKSRALLGDALISDYRHVRVQAWLDANAFEERLEQDPAQALQTYKGDFLPSFFIRDARDFEAWQLREQEKLHEKFVQATLKQAQAHVLSAPQHAVDLLRHALEFAPTRDELHHALVHAYHQQGNRTLALKQYEAYRRMLWEEYGTEPNADAQALFAQLETAPALVLRTPTHLPSRLSSLVGREDSLAQTEQLLFSTRLVTLTARGGAGKTRLALELAYRLQGRFADGVCFVDLSDLRNADHVPTSVAQALGLTLEGDDALAQVTAYLANRDMLLILDNFEQVLPASHVVAHWLSHTKKARFLVTSREPLKLYGEHVYHVPALSLAESCQLFYERVRALQGDLTRQEGQDAVVKQICQHLEGLPLAIELASTHARTLNFSDILQGLQRRLELLVSDLRHVPRRQRALFHTIDWSYTLLTPEQQGLLRHLAVFKGGWTQEAAIAVSPYARELHALAEKHLVRRVSLGSARFTMLESIREYAHYQLTRHNETEARQEALARWVCQFVEESAEATRTAQHVQAFNNVMQENDNIRTALDYLAQRPDQSELYARMVGALGWIWNPLGICDEPFVHAQRAMTNASNLPKAIRAALLVSGGHSAYALGHSGLSQAWFSEALRLFEEVGDALQAEYVNFFMACHLDNRKDEIPRLYGIRKRALKLNEPHLLAIVNMNLGASLADVGELSQSLAILEEGLRMCETYQYRLYMPAYYINLSDTQAQLGNVERALSLLEKAEQTSEASGNTFLRAFSLFEACQISYNAGDFVAIEARLARAEPLVQSLFSPTLWVRFYFWRAVIAEHHKDVVQFYQAYGQIFSYLQFYHVNLSEYTINVLLYSAYLFARYNNFERAGTLFAYADSYADTLQRQYRDYQLIWRDAVLDHIKAPMEVNSTPDLETLLALANDVLDVLV